MMMGLTQGMEERGWYMQLPEWWGGGPLGLLDKALRGARGCRFAAFGLPQREPRGVVDCIITCPAHAPSPALRPGAEPRASSATVCVFG